MDDGLSAFEFAVDLLVTVAIITVLFGIFGIGKALILKNTVKTTEIAANLNATEYSDYDDKDLTGKELLDFYRDNNGKQIDFDTSFRFEVHTLAIIDAYASLNTDNDTTEKANIRARFSIYPAGTPEFGTVGYATDLSVNSSDPNYICDDFIYHTTLIKESNIVVGLKIVQEDL